MNMNEQINAEIKCMLTAFALSAESGTLFLNDELRMLLAERVMPMYRKIRRAQLKAGPDKKTVFLPAIQRVEEGDKHLQTDAFDGSENA